MINISFLHTHYIPKQLIEQIHIDSSIVALEVYPDLLYSYYRDYSIFGSLEECIYWHNIQYAGRLIKFTIENIALLKDVSSLKIAKEMGLVAVQLYHSQTNAYFDKKRGLTDLGYRLLNSLTEYDIFLDLSHLNDIEINYVLSRYSGKVINSHCVCSELIETINPRSNAISSDTIKRLSERNCLFGIPFVNDMVAKVPHDTEENDSSIMIDIVSQIVYFVKCAGAENVALGPDFMDTVYFSKVYKHNIKIPDVLFKASGYQIISIFLKQNNISEKDIRLIMCENINNLLIK